MFGIPDERIRVLNDATVRPGRYVLYWMQAAHRTEENPALAYAMNRAAGLSQPLIVYFGIWNDYPEANLRHFVFMLEGLLEVGISLESMGVRFLLNSGPPDEGALRLAGDASLLVVDRGYLRENRELYHKVASRCRCPFVQVEGNVIVPVNTASGKEEYSAATFRPRVLRLLDRFIEPNITPSPELPVLRTEFPSLAGESPGTIIRKLNIDRDVMPSPAFHGGTGAAKKRFEIFLTQGLDQYADSRNDPAGPGSSDMSPYLHFGQISPVTLASGVREYMGDGSMAFLEQLIVRRELAINFVTYNPLYGDFNGLPTWARKTLSNHKGDPREYIYSVVELERGLTHDPYWNAAQNEMVKTGKMHGYMRMYWGKKILEWTKSPSEAFRIALALNNKYEIDGRDPNGYAGVAWCFGKHDRPWKERNVFGMVRYMNSAGLKRKFKIDRYADKIREIL